MLHHRRAEPDPIKTCLLQVLLTRDSILLIYIHIALKRRVLVGFSATAKGESEKKSVINIKSFFFPEQSDLE